MNGSHCKHGIVKTDCGICTTENIKRHYSSAQSASLFDTDRFHAIALDVEFEYGMGGLCGTVYEEFAKDICIRYLSKRQHED